MPLHDIVPGASPAEDRTRLNTALAGLLLGNATLILSYAVGWIALGELLWTYWLQSVMIGVFHFFRMRSLQRFTTEGMKMNDRPVPATPAGRDEVTRFFVMHYGFFHAIYAVFLAQRHLPTGFGAVWLLGVGAMFAAGEWSTLRRHRASDATWEPDLGTMMMQPYVRILPMHLAIGGASWAGAVFLPLKAAADLGMFLIDEHMDAKRARAGAAADAVNAVGATDAAAGAAGGSGASAAER